MNPANEILVRHCATAALEMPLTQASEFIGSLILTLGDKPEAEHLRRAYVPLQAGLHALQGIADGQQDLKLG